MGSTDGPASQPFSYDVFVSHASEDKAEFVDDLVRALSERGLRVWYDTFEITLGDDFRRQMERGLLGSRFGVVVVSHAFLQSTKYWAQQELSVLFNFEAVDGEKRILPVVRGVDWKTLTKTSPFLATRRVADASAGVDAVAEQILVAVRNLKAEPSGRASRLYGVPLPSQSFVGRRKKLEQLKQEFAKGDVRVCAAVEGLPGVGKTELVLKLAHELAEAGEFPGGIYWLPAELPDLTTIWAGETMAGAMGIPGETARDRALQTVNAINRREARVLVILDNAETWEKDHQPAPLPTGPNVTLLVTTRRSHLGGTRFRSFPLEFLGAAEARALVTGLAGGSAADRPGFAALLDYLDGHALGLELCGIYLREYPEVAPETYLTGLKAGRELDAKVADESRYQASVNQGFAMLWERLDGSTRGFWQRASWFAPEPATAALADACGLDGDARHALHRYHLVDLDNDGRFRMHRLTRAFGQQAGDEKTRDEARRAFLDGVSDRARSIDIAAGFRIYVSDRAQFEWALSLSQAEPSAWEGSSNLLDRIGTALHSLGELPRARELLEMALASDLKNLGEDHPEVATRRSNLATVLKDIGELSRARELLERALASNLKNLGEDHPEVATYRSNLALVLQDLGELPRARELLEMALDSNLKNFGEDHPAVAADRSNLATVLKNLGDLPRARELLEMALDSDLKNFGMDHPGVAIRRSNLATVLQGLGDLPRARGLLEMALDSNLKNFGEDHPAVATDRYNLAWIYEAEGDLQTALTLLARILQSGQIGLGADNPSLALVRAKTANLLFQTGEVAQARQEAAEALRVVANQPAGSFYRENVEFLTAWILDGSEA